MNYKLTTKFLLVYLLFAIAIILTASTVGLELFKYTLRNNGISDELLLNHLMNSLYLVLFIVFLLSLSILLCINAVVYKPLSNITEAAKEFSCGNLDYEISLTTGDEFGYLAATLNYMTTILRDSRDYQKQLVENVSHDFRSPLTSIKGYTNAILDGTIPVNDQSKYLNIISSEADRLHDLSNDLVCLVELESKNISLNYSKVDLVELIHYTTTSLYGTLSKRNIETKLEIETKDLNLQLKGTTLCNNIHTIDIARDKLFSNCDEDKIKRVLHNLLDNSIKFSLNNSIISIHIADVLDKYLVTVSDNGCGIADDQIGKVFQRFYKADHSRGVNKNGSGLGLAIVKEILQQHNQKISVESLEGQGTKFIFSLDKFHI